MTPKQILAKNSKSFALAARLLPPGVAEDAAVVYAFCRKADDAIDLAPLHERPAALDRLREELAQIYAGDGSALASVVQRRAIPRAYLDELLDGMEMDVRRTSYDSLASLLLYCHRVAGTVGLMMCHVMGVRDTRALKHAAHLGLAMQLTNICRDVAEDARDGRTYLPSTLLAEHGERGAAKILLDEADRYYASADTGIALLPWRCALAVRTARLVYSEIGRRIAARGYDVSTRAVVSTARKLVLLLKAVLATVPRRAKATGALALVRFPDDVLPL